jgi:subtilase family serine protease
MVTGKGDMKRLCFSAASLALVVSTLLAVQAPPVVQASPAIPAQVHACAAVPAGFARCFAIGLTNPNAGPNNPATRLAARPIGPSARTVSSCPAGPNSGYTPCQLQNAYVLTSAASTNGAGETEAIVDAYLDATAFSDVNTYRAQFGLSPLTNCATSDTTHHCFWQVGQTGSTSALPTRSNAGWTAEQSLDVDMASAICPNCNILLIEANSSSTANLDAGVTTAASFGHNVVSISNSWGGSEFSSETSDATFTHPGIAITASTGDSGYGVQYPASSPYVTAVGGTSLAQSSNGWSETAWSGAGSGCSAYVAQPSWQSSVGNITSVCGKRAVADVSADADPNTGVAVYNSSSYQYVKAGWQVWGGTSVASPIIAGVYALAGNTSTSADGSYSYSHTSSLFDVTNGSNGSCGNLLCNATTGWDGPTGNGTPNGTGAF